MIDTELFFSSDRTTIETSLSQWGGSPLPGREDEIRLGKLLHFKQVDKRLELPPGTAKRLLVTVAERYNLVPSYQTENVIRFKQVENIKKGNRR